LIAVPARVKSIAVPAVARKTALVTVRVSSTKRSPIVTDALGTDVIGTDVIGTDVIGTDATGTDATGTNPMGTNRTTLPAEVGITATTTVQVTDMEMARVTETETVTDMEMARVTETETVTVMEMVTATVIVAPRGEESTGRFHGFRGIPGRKFPTHCHRQTNRKSPTRHRPCRNRKPPSHRHR
jgi:hypothetical protein